MCKTLVALLVIVAIAHAATPSHEEAKAELVAFGVSSPAADDIVAIGDKYNDQLGSAESNHISGKAAFDALYIQLETYIKTHPEADHTFYATFVRGMKKKYEHQGRHSTPSA